MSNDSVKRIVNECRAIPEFDRTPEQQTIVTLSDTIISSYENLTGELWNENLTKDTDAGCSCCDNPFCDGGPGTYRG